MQNNQNGHDALFLTVSRLIRLARENKIYTTQEALPEVARLLSDAAGAVEMASGKFQPAPLPCIIPGQSEDGETITAKPYDRRQEG